MMKRNWRHGPAIGLAGLLAACGGAGGGIGSNPAPPVANPAPTPTPAPTPAPTPTPAPSPTINYDTAEYRATVGAISMNALAAYNRGATGAGIGIGIIDSGIDLDSAEFTGRIAAASTDVASTRTVDDEDGHGTAVAFTAAGRRNGTGTHGVAFDASLIVLRADQPGSCATQDTGTDSTGCQFPTSAIARGLDAARSAGARVVNISLGGSSAMPPGLVAAINRATAAGIVVVIASGNDGANDPDLFAQIANDNANARNQVIIAGSVGATGTISTFTNLAGSSAPHFLSAVGEQVRAPDETGTLFLWSGTSFAAPQISGAVALLAQAFPNLTGAQIVDILYRTAQDAGAAGIDAVYGRGILNLSAAFQPVGGTSVAGTAAAVSFGNNAVLSAPMGDARSAGLGAVILDGYGRAFATDLAHGISRAAPTPGLAPALLHRVRAVGMQAGGTTVSMTLAPQGPRGDVLLRPSYLTVTDAQGARAIAGTVTQALGRSLSFGFGFGSGGGALTAQLTGQAEPAFLIAPAGSMGFDSVARGTGAIRQAWQGLGITAAIDSGQVLTRRDALRPVADGWNRSRYDRAALTLDRRFGDLLTTLTASRLMEGDTLLGARFGPGLGCMGATSWFADAAARWRNADGWTLGATWRQGWTHASARHGLAGTARLRTTAFAADIGKAGVFGRDSLGLRVAQPLRVARGGIDYRLPTGWDYAGAGVSAWTVQRLNLAPTGREIDMEARYTLPLGPGDLHTNLFWRRDPGNIAALPDDYGLALRWAFGL